MTRNSADTSTKPETESSATESSADDARRELLTSLGLNPDADKMAGGGQAPAKKSKKKPEKKGEVDRRTIPAAEIVFDPADLEQFGDLDGANFANASRHLFDLYKSPHRDRERHALLHRKIGEHLQQVRRSRKTDGLVAPVKERVKATKEQRDLAALLAAKGLTAADLAALINEKG